eukprot:16451416-Heterocapsa_arctica.AAC.1
MTKKERIPPSITGKGSVQGSEESMTITPLTTWTTEMITLGMTFHLMMKGDPQNITRPSFKKTHH